MISLHNNKVIFLSIYFVECTTVTCSGENCQHKEKEVESDVTNTPIQTCRKTERQTADQHHRSP